MSSTRKTRMDRYKNQDINVEDEYIKSKKKTTGSKETTKKKNHSKDFDIENEKTRVINIDEYLELKSRKAKKTNHNDKKDESKTNHKLKDVDKKTKKKNLEKDDFEFTDEDFNFEDNEDFEIEFEEEKPELLNEKDEEDADYKEAKLDDIFKNSRDKMSNTFFANDKELKSFLREERKGKKLEEKNKKKNSKKMKLWQKIVVFFICIGIVLGSILGFFLYGPYPKFREWLITTAMTTMNHQYLAKWFYSDKTIDEVLKRNYVKESGEDTDASKVTFIDYSKTKIMYKNKYEKEILTKDKGNDLYKLININDGSMRGYLVAIYDPSKVKMETATTMGTKGEMLVSMAKRTDSVVAMNASGFIDPNYNSNGGRPYGVVIKNGKIVSNLEKANVGGGVIGFTKDNKLILGKMSGEEALKKGIRDAMEFGPYLIVNGKPSFIKGNGGWGTAPRSAIGQRQDGIVLFLVMDGRDYSHGVDGVGMVELTEILAKYGAYNASNLDGGTSSGLVINGELISKPVNGSGEKLTRAIPDAWIVSK